MTTEQLTKYLQARQSDVTVNGGCVDSSCLACRLSAMIDSNQDAVQLEHHMAMMLIVEVGSTEPESEIDSINITARIIRDAYALGILTALEIGEAEQLQESAGD